MEAILFIGIQASGKSTFYQQQFKDTHIRINLDMLNTRNREKCFLETCLKTQQPFVIDNTNPQPEDRKRYIPLIKEQRFKVTGYYFQSKIEAAISRNHQRDPEQQVPELAIKHTYSKLILPTYSEGFDQLFYVQQQPQKQFLVQEWNDEI